MKFRLIPVIDKMLELYNAPRGYERFKDYLQLLQGDTSGDLSLPISGFNPMAKEHITVQLLRLKSIGAEGSVVTNTLHDLSQQWEDFYPDHQIDVVINLLDDLKGGWTNQYTADYDSRFKINAYAARGFSVVALWASRVYSLDHICLAVRQFCLRTIFWHQHGRITTLAQHVLQELFVAHHCGISTDFVESDFYRENADSDQYDLIFNYLYGDSASRSLGYRCYGESEIGILTTLNLRNL